MSERLIEDERGRKLLVRFIEHQQLPFVATIKGGKLRSLDQNRLQWKWASEAAEQRQDVTPREVVNEWKLMFGVPILCAESEEFAVAWLRPEVELSHPVKLRLIEIVPVTSLMTTKSMKQYLDEVYRHCTENGIELSVPDDMKWKAP